MGVISTVTGSKFFIYAKLGAVLALVLAAAWGAWYVRAAIADQQTQRAVKTAVEKVQKELDEERKTTAYYRELSDKQLQTLLDKLTNLRVEHTTITRNITLEREIHKEFYMQPLPAGGYEEWKRSRASVGASAASAVQP